MVIQKPQLLKEKEEPKEADSNRRFVCIPAYSVLPLSNSGSQRRQVLSQSLCFSLCSLNTCVVRNDTGFNFIHTPVLLSTPCCTQTPEILNRNQHAPAATLGRGFKSRLSAGRDGLRSVRTGSIETNALSVACACRGWLYARFKAPPNWDPKRSPKPLR